MFNFKKNIGKKMPRKTDKRERLVKAAKLLAHKKGFNFTTLADIAQESEVPLGNVYYYFKTKEDIGKAVISKISSEINEFLESLNNVMDSREKLFKFVNYQVEQIDLIKQYGCPIGGLCQELAKQGGVLADCISELMRNVMSWVEQQFVDLGCEQGKAHMNAMQFIANIQGMCLLVNTYKDAAIIHKMSDSIKHWVKNVAVKQPEFA